MALVSSSIPNLLGGVSQQAPSTRAMNTSQGELNTYHSLVSGLAKRPPADYVAKVHEAAEESSDATVHAFQTSGGKEFLLVIDSDSEATGRAAVVGVADGKVYEVDLTNDNGYITGVSGNYNAIFRFLTVGDTTFILNRSVSPVAVPVPEDADDPEGAADVTYTVTAFEDLPDPNSVPVGVTGKADGSFYINQRAGRFASSLFDFAYNQWVPWSPSTDRSRKDPKRTAAAYIRQAVHNTTYSFTVEFEDGSTAVATYQTPESVDAQGDPVSINTDTIVDGLVASFSSASASAVAVGSTVSIQATQDIRKISYNDSFGDLAMRAYGASVQDFADLPPNEIEGRVVRINGAVETGGDDYFVEYRDGLWQETVAYGQRSELDKTTMPLTLVYDAVNDTFDIADHEWPGRTAGDAVSNPAPTFVGRLINDMFLFKGRMVFLADENVLFSEVGYYENFYRTTLTQLIETDPIDVAATTAQTSVLHHGVAFDETLVVFSNRQQFRILSGDTLTPQNISIAPTTAFNASVRCAPEAVGPNVMFVEDAGLSRYASVMEYYRNPNTEADDAADVTSAVPKFIPSGVKSIRAAANENIVAVLTENNGGDLYVYKYFWSGGEKVISSWTPWKVSGCEEILSIDFFSDALYALVRDVEAQVHLVRIDCEEGKTDGDLDYRILLDMKVDGRKLIRSFDPDFEQTRWRIPMRPGGAVPVIVVAEDTGDYPAGYIIPVDSVDGRFVYAQENLVDVPVWIGFTYRKEYEFSPIFIRNQHDGVLQDNRLSLRYVTVFFDDTSAFRVEVTPRGRRTWTGHYSGRKFSDATAVTDQVANEPGQWRFAAKGKTDNLKILIVNDTPFPSALTSALWEGQYSPRARRV